MSLYQSICNLATERLKIDFLVSRLAFAILNNITSFFARSFCSVNERSNVKKHFLFVSKSLLGGPHNLHVHLVQ